MTGKRVTLNEEVIEMEEGRDGKFYPMTIVKMKDPSMIRNDAIKELPRWFPAMYEVIDGFAMGLGAIENFMMNMKKLNRRRKNVHMD